MAADVNKHLDRAKRFLEKNRAEDAIGAYLAVLEEAPQHQEATQALGDLYARTGQPDRAVVYYGLLFDLLVEPRDETKAVAIYNRFLRTSSVQQPPERIARYAFLQQRQNRSDEALDQYNKAAELFTAESRAEDALFCLERIAQLDADNPHRQLRLGEAAEQLGKQALAARAFLRAGQLTSVKGDEAEALKQFERAHKLAPRERSVALLYGTAQLRAGNPEDAVALLKPFAATEHDAEFLDTYAKALIHASHLDPAREVLERLLREKNEGVPRLFELVDAYAAAGEDKKCGELLQTLKRRMFADKKQDEFAAQMNLLEEKHPRSQAILEFMAALYDELNRETPYFETLIKLFDVYLQSGKIPKACESLERLVDIDPYDHRNQQRLEMLRGRVDEAFWKRVSGRLVKSATAALRPSLLQQGTAQPLREESREVQALDDLIVQTEIFLQYALQNKALDRLQKIAAMFPGEETRNARLANLYQLANWSPPGGAKQKTTSAAAPAAAPPPPVVEAQPTNITGKTGSYTAETLRDLTKIAEINQKIFRQQTPRAMLNTAVHEVGTYLRATRSLAVIGAPGRPPELSAEFCSPDVKPTPGAQAVLLLAQMEKAEPDQLGGLVVGATQDSIVSELGLATALGVTITDKETQNPAGMLIVGDAADRKWKPNEAYFLQAIGDQMLMSVTHTRLRSLVRRMGVSDERTGLLSRSSYQSCLLTEADRARTQDTPLALAILQIDRGAEILRQQGESTTERFLEQLARSLQAIVRQNDIAVKYTSWALAFILPDTTLNGAQQLAEKLRRAASGLRPPWDATQITLSAGIVEAVAKQEYDSEDIVTDLINRAEFSLEEARKRGGDTIVTLENPKL
ncbi:MAG TPA: diguanylate cyclase [Candidatus Dormibacteraeota bacterium]|nr:diguanylate cyclase [Candidatus Dormibacteraeota bacterium]